MAPYQTPEEAAQDLLRLATTRFGQLSEAEAKLLRAAPKGQWAACGPSADFDDPSNDPAKADDWGPERQVRAELIRWLCTDREVASRVDPKGIQLLGARITGSLDLSFASVPFPLWLLRCRLADQVLLISTQLPALYLDGSRTGPILADGLSVKGDLFLREGFTAEGEVRLLGAQLSGNLDCSSGTFKNPPQEGLPESGKALIADSVNVKGNVFLREGFTAEGEVRLPNAQIGGVLDCSGGTFKNPAQKGVAGSGKALNADSVDVKGSVFLHERFTAEGEVRLTGAQIGGDLECSYATFKNPPQKDVAASGKALIADGADVKGSVFLREGFTAEGEVRLLGGQIGGGLDCSGGTFKNPPQKELSASGKALSADRAIVKGDVFLGDDFTAEGEVRLLGARIGGDLDCSGGVFKELTVEGANIARHLLVALIQDAPKGKMNLTNASADALLDDEASWPAAGNLRLDGFVYGRITVGPTDAEPRLKWLALQPAFTPQPYRQFAKVLREMGDDRGARLVLYEMECRRREQEDKTWYSRLWGRVLWATIGYGLCSRRALGWLVSLTLLGTLLFGLGHLGGSMAPTEREAYACFEKQGWPPRHYQQFNPLVYSLENSVPLLRLGQDSAWAPDPGPREQEHPGAVNFAPFKWLGRVAASWHLTRLAPPWFLRFFRWCQITLGWMLATLFVAGVTGVVRRE